MAVKCGVCGNKERFSSSAELKLELTVDCDGRVICHDLDKILSELNLRPQACSECKSRKLVESEFISDHEWDVQITQALERRRLEQDMQVRPIDRGKRNRHAS